MTVLELKRYLRRFKNTDTVAVRMWNANGPRYMLPNVNSKLRALTVRSAFKANKQRFAVVGYFDNCLAHEVGFILQKGMRPR